MPIGEEPIELELLCDYLQERSSVALTPSPIEGCFFPQSEEACVDQLVQIEGLQIKGVGFKFEKCFLELPGLLPTEQVMKSGDPSIWTNYSPAASAHVAFSPLTAFGQTSRYSSESPQMFSVRNFVSPNLKPVKQFTVKDVNNFFILSRSFATVLRRFWNGYAPKRWIFSLIPSPRLKSMAGCFWFGFPFKFPSSFSRLSFCSPGIGRQRPSF